MRKDLQYLKSLKTFEVTAQLLSFTKAAESLCVTQAAISHQIRQLEEHLGIRLFFRLTRQIALTAEGQTLFSTLSRVFGTIEDTMEQLRQSTHAHQHLTVAVSPAFSTRWLVARLPGFCSKYPDLDIKLHHTLQHTDLRHGEVNAAIRWGDGNWPGLVVEPLFGTRLSPVCTPGYLQAGRPLVTSHDLAHHTLLHEDSHDDWRRWLQSTGCDYIDANGGPLIDDSNALLAATLDGQGIALGRLALIRPELESGKLVQPFPGTLESKGRYWLVYDDAQKSRPAILAFRTFLAEQIDAAERLFCS